MMINRHVSDTRLPNSIKGYTVLDELCHSTTSMKFKISLVSTKNNCLVLVTRTDKDGCEKFKTHCVGFYPRDLWKAKLAVGDGMIKVKYMDYISLHSLDM